MMKSDAARLCAFLLLGSAADAAEPPLVEAQIKFISMTRPLVGVGVAHGKQATGLVIPTDMLSDPIVYRGPARLELIETNVKELPTKAPAAGPEDKDSAASRPSRGVKARSKTMEHIPAGKPPLAWVDLPTNLGRLNLILLVTPGKDNGITVLNDPPGSFPPGKQPVSEPDARANHGEGAVRGLPDRPGRGENPPSRRAEQRLLRPETDHQVR